ncbi:dehydrodolichyl diphosphate synthase complex subunit NUS1 [Neocloeon triangulifer]|uniref:dehydrodolichyl diphosphate synthase complex subunit NUS1 n=1 Tax=Neocloeon triangulifer TaxID=2078957 RepID=UPI00286F842A|nr:dehydrodolichyl diphosphate synthase complex subunit NUS1 [Neocloeon triangulifer]
MYLLYRILLGLVHFLFWCLESVAFACLFARRRYGSLWGRGEPADDFRLVADCVKHLKNVPTHVAFVLVDENVVSAQDLANVIVWSFAAGISFLTLYDHDGKIKTCEAKLMQELARRADTRILKNIVWDSLSCSNGHNDISNGNGHCNGYKNGYSSHKLRINLMSYEDGRPKIIRAAVELGLREKMGNINRDERLTVGEADEVIRAVYQSQFGSMPDPELVVWCGTTTCPAGFLPWHTSLTEFLRLQSHHGLNSSDFRTLMTSFSKCEQRLGK